jgi:hypothetical protein
MRPTHTKSSTALATAHARAELPHEWLTMQLLRDVCTTMGPFVSVYLPARHPGAADQSAEPDFAAILQTVEFELGNRRFLGPADDLLEPLRKLALDQERSPGGDASVMFAGRGYFRNFRLPETAEPRTVVASFPLITPLLAMVDRTGDYFVLALAKGELRLGRWHEGKCGEVPLPAEIPPSFEKTFAADQQDHDLQNRAGTARFGTSVQREILPEQLHQYFQRVDRELAATLGGAPLVLIGIERELAAYRDAASYRHLLYARPTSPEHQTWTELGELAGQAILASVKDDQERALLEFREFPRRDQIITNLREVLDAAREGRIHKLLLERGAEQQGLLGPAFPLNDERLEGNHDLINAAAVETLRKGGQVSVVEDGALGDSRVGAILRYAIS